jgi:Amt family ammonium transporter
MTTTHFDSSVAKLRKTSGIVFGVVVAFLVTLAIASSGDPVGSGDFLDSTIKPLDEAWVLFSAALVFLMQAGFLCFEVGLARHQHTTAVAMKNIVDWTVSTLAFTIVGFGLMFGSSAALFGTDLFALNGLGDVDAGTVSGITFFLFQLAFAGTAITIVSGSLVERTSMLAYVSISVVLGVVIYPLFGQWVWGNLLDPTNDAWLADLGFHDFAGGSVVHLTGGMVALVGVVAVGPRLGRFGPNGEVNRMAPSSIGLTLLGVIILWVGWWGFNGGSALQLDRSVASIILVTNIAAVSGLSGAGLWAYLFQDRLELNAKLIGGAVGGLVAITSGADILNPTSAIAIGVLAGIAYSLTFDLLLKFQIDDALGVVPAHAVCGGLGIILLAVFAPASAFENGRLEQIGVQLLGVLVCISWSGGISWFVYKVVSSTFGLRIAPHLEIHGQDLEASAERAEAEEEFTDAELAALLGDG